MTNGQRTGVSIKGLMVVGPHEPYLREVLEHNFRRLNIQPVVACNNCDPITKRLLKEFGADFYDDNREWGLYQPAIKTDLLKYIQANHQPDWILACDADEVIDCDRETLEYYASLPSIAWQTFFVHYWNDTTHHNPHWGFWNVRFFRNMPEHGVQYLRKNVHCGLAPPTFYHYANDMPVIMWHYGLMDKAKRMAKVERYKQYDANANFMDASYYEMLASPYRGEPLNKDEMREKVRADIANRKSMKGMPVPQEPEGWVLIERDGRKIDVPAADLRRYERQGWKVAPKKEAPKEIPKETPEPSNEEKPKRRKK